MHRALKATVTTLLGGLAMVLLAGPLTVQAENASNTRVTADQAAHKAQVDARIASLMAMSKDQRRAELKQLSPDQRRELWFALKRTKGAQRGQQPAVRGAGLARHPIAGAKAKAATEAVGSIVYDDGTPTISFGGGSIIGNRFDTHNGNPVMVSGTVETVVGVVVQGGGFTTSSAGFVLLGPQTGGGGAFALFSSFTGATGTTDTVTFAGLGVGYTGSSFFVLFGDFANSYVPAFGTGTNNGQGHHGVVGYTGGMGPNITGTFDFGGTLNGLVRVTGNVVPVELMSFDVE